MSGNWTVYLQGGGRCYVVGSESAEEAIARVKNCGFDAVSAKQGVDAPTCYVHNGNGDIRPKSLVEAAKTVVALSGWSTRPNGDKVYVTSAMAIAVLRRAIDEAENPVLRLAPEPIPQGL